MKIVTVPKAWVGKDAGMQGQVLGRLKEAGIEAVAAPHNDGFVLVDPSSGTLTLSARGETAVFVFHPAPPFGPVVDPRDVLIASLQAELAAVIAQRDTLQADINAKSVAAPAVSNASVPPADAPATATVKIV